MASNTIHLHDRFTLVLVHRADDIGGPRRTLLAIANTAVKVWQPSRPRGCEFRRKAGTGNRKPSPWRLFPAYVALRTLRLADACRNRAEPPPRQCREIPISLHRNGKHATASWPFAEIPFKHQLLTASACVARLDRFGRLAFRPLVKTRVVIDSCCRRYRNAICCARSMWDVSHSGAIETHATKALLHHWGDLDSESWAYERYGHVYDRCYADR